MNQKSFEEVMQQIINNIKDVIPQADTKAGTFIRDVFIDPNADEIAALYSEMKQVEYSQSILTATGTALDNLALNYFITRKKAKPSVGELWFYIDYERALTQPYIKIPKGTIVMTKPTLNDTTVRVQTIEEVNKTIDEIKNSVANGMTPFIKCIAESIETGTEMNVKAGKLTQQINNFSEYILGVENPYDFYNGYDGETDNELLQRIKIALSGANIGTKDGYLSYLLKQDGVEDVRVIDAGYIPQNGQDNIMIRDNKIGGKVDIYVKGETVTENTDSINSKADIIRFFIQKENINEYSKEQLMAIMNAIYGYENEKLNNLNKEELIELVKYGYKLSKQPVKNIQSINIYYSEQFENSEDVLNMINEDIYEFEPSFHDFQIANKTYYKDYLWDFTSATLPTIMTENNNMINIENTSYSNEELKTIIDKNLKQAMIYLKNMTYAIDYNDLNKLDQYDSNNNLITNNFFDKYSDSNNNVYIIKSNSLNSDANLFKLMTFVRKENDIYLRIYVKDYYDSSNEYCLPMFNFSLIKETGYINNDSVNANDIIEYCGINKINFINQDDKLILDTSWFDKIDYIEIIYNYVSSISDLQQIVNNKKVITADVLVKRATPIGVEINVNVKINQYGDSNFIIYCIKQNIDKYINNEKSLGDRISISELINQINSIDNVLYVDLNNTNIGIIDDDYNYTSINDYIINDNRYYNLVNLNIYISTI